MSIDQLARAAAAEARSVAAAHVDPEAMLARMHRMRRNRAVGRRVVAVVLVGALITAVMHIAGSSGGHRVNSPARPPVTPSSTCGGPKVACLGNNRFRVELPVPVLVKLPDIFFPDFSVYSNGFDALRKGQQAGVTVMERVLPAKNDASWTRDRAAGTTAESIAVWLSHRPFLEHAAVVGATGTAHLRLNVGRSLCEVEPSIELRATVARLMDARPAEWTARSGGFTPTERWSFDLADGRRVFAKRSTEDWLAETLRTEYRILRMVEAGLRCDVLGWQDGERPVLLLEDLRHGYWPPPWRPGDIDQVLSALERMWAMPADGLPSAEEIRKIMSGWHLIAENPSAFLQLQIATPRWLDRCLEPLRDAADAASYAGDAFLHMDIRSDNICLVGDRVVLVDWNWAVRGPRELDLACWLPSLRLEGGPLPEEVATGLGAYAAAIASYFAVNAALPPVPASPHLRRFQLDQLTVALPWACRELDLPQPDRLHN